MEEIGSGEALIKTKRQNVDDDDEVGGCDPHRLRQIRHRKTWTESTRRMRFNSGSNRHTLLIDLRSFSEFNGLSVDFFFATTLTLPDEVDR